MKDYKLFLLIFCLSFCLISGGCSSIVDKSISNEYETIDIVDEPISNEYETIGIVDEPIGKIEIVDVPTYWPKAIAVHLYPSPSDTGQYAGYLEKGRIVDVYDIKIIKYSDGTQREAYFIKEITPSHSLQGWIKASGKYLNYVPN
ncbi:MAG: hypothetical protein PHV39_08025 [Methanomicrobium sp.]|nr:hypothetical protein [Methanomicrobium sp.]